MFNELKEAILTINQQMGIQEMENISQKESNGNSN